MERVAQPDQSGLRKFSAIGRSLAVLSGTPCLAGTRIPVDSLVSRFAGGETIASIAEDYDHVTTAQVEDAIRLFVCAMPGRYSGKLEAAMIKLLDDEQGVIVRRVEPRQQPTREPRRHPLQVTTTRRGAGRTIASASMAPDDVRDHIRTALQQRPLTMSELYQPIKGRFGYAAFRQMVTMMKLRGELIQASSKAWGSAYSLPAEGQPVHRPVCRTVEVPTGSARIALIDKHFAKVLNTGASYAFVEIVRAVRREVPDLQESEIEARLLERTTAGAVDVLMVGSMKRYRRAPKWGERRAIEAPDDSGQED